jgi:triosephosphate isomerase (TIM)
MQFPPRRPLVAGNWKMNGVRSSAVELEQMIDGIGELGRKLDVMVCPPATLIAEFAAVARGSPVAIGGQDCHAEVFGAYTGDISAEMLADAGASAVIVGHSERRAGHGEDDGTVRSKALAARRAGLAAIVCVGETRDERERGQTLEVVFRQLEGSVPESMTGAGLVIAYEPVWAIGTGLTPTTQDIADMHAAIHRHLSDRFGPEGERIRVLYGGSVKPRNARELLSVRDVDGALVGGASLEASEFLAIIAAYG